ncbi:hypothetical protein [Tychonema sp. BBK16]|nr:hypothetical protein [Tychonema sp. BBK16]
MRGGSWTFKALTCRSAYRKYGSAGYSKSYLGFRVALVFVLPASPSSL